MAEIKTISDVLQMQLDIPNFQRPYKWQNKNVIDLLEDINVAIQESKKYDDFKYRIGTIILYENDNGTYDIVDGQQRLLSLSLIQFYLNKKFSCSLLDNSCNNKVSQANIKKNFECIKNWFAITLHVRQVNFHPGLHG